MIDLHVPVPGGERESSDSVLEHRMHVT
jgi:hypothetical protein